MEQILEQFPIVIQSLNVPSGAFIILFLVVLFLALKAIKPLLRR